MFAFVLKNTFYKISLYIYFYFLNILILIKKISEKAII